jgi:hypothetical protein
MHASAGVDVGIGFVEVGSADREVKGRARCVRDGSGAVLCPVIVAVVPTMPVTRTISSESCPMSRVA